MNRFQRSKEILEEIIEYHRNDDEHGVLLFCEDRETSASFKGDKLDDYWNTVRFMDDDIILELNCGTAHILIGSEKISPKSIFEWSDESSSDVFKALEWLKFLILDREGLTG